MTEMICIVCPKGCHLHVDEKNNYKVTGNRCKKGVSYGQQELINPVRTITSTCKISHAILPRIPVKTMEAIPKSKMMAVMHQINHIELDAPVHMGEIIIENVSDTGIDIVACRDMERVS